MGIQDDFDRQGFAVVRDLAPPDLVASLGAVYDRMLSGDVACPGDDRQLGDVTRQIMHPHKHHPLCADNAAITAARELSKGFLRTDAPAFFFSMLIHKPPRHPHETPWHQDVSYLEQPMTPPGIVCERPVIAQFWLALDDVDETMGCMEFVPGEHRKPMPRHRIASGDPEEEGRLLTTDDPALAYDLAAAVRCPVPAGSATVHDYAAPHRTGPNTSDRHRRAFIFSFVNQDAFDALGVKVAA